MRSHPRRTARRPGVRLEILEDRAHPSVVFPAAALGAGSSAAPSPAAVEVGVQSSGRVDSTTTGNSAVDRPAAEASPGTVVVEDFSDPLLGLGNGPTTLGPAAGDATGAGPEAQDLGASIDPSNLGRGGSLTPLSGLDGDALWGLPVDAYTPGRVNDQGPSAGQPTPMSVALHRPPQGGNPAILGAGTQRAPSLGDAPASGGARGRTDPGPGGASGVGERAPQPVRADLLAGISPVGLEHWERDLGHFLSRIGVLDDDPDPGDRGASWRTGLLATTVVLVTREVAIRRRRDGQIVSDADEGSDAYLALTGPWPLGPS